MKRLHLARCEACTPGIKVDLVGTTEDPSLQEFPRSRAQNCWFIGYMALIPHGNEWNWSSLEAWHTGALKGRNVGSRRRQPTDHGKRRQRKTTLKGLHNRESHGRSLA